MRPIITLTTDFGLRDPFIGIMKGVILSIAPEVRLVDITHDIEPQNIAVASLVLDSACKYFPAKSIHLAVVDPGVGSSRKPIAVQSGGSFYVGPDNGLLTPFLLKKGARVVELKEKRFFLNPISATFHGRDVFSPVAAWLARGTSLDRLGPRIRNAKTISQPLPEVKKGSVRGEIIYADRFGNLTTNITLHTLREAFRFVNSLAVEIGDARVDGPFASYSQVPRGRLGSIFNSWGHLEIFCREDNAAQKLGCGAGAPLVVLPGT